jgi:hypothetical protein
LAGQRGVGVVQESSRGIQMHFRAQMTVMLDDPLPIEGEDGTSNAIGYIIVIGVNATDIAAAARYAHDVALRPKQSDGSFRSFKGVVEEAEIKRENRLGGPWGTARWKARGRSTSTDSSLPRRCSAATV